MTDPIKYDDQLIDIVDNLIDNEKEVKIIKLPRKNGPKKQMLFKGARLR